MSATNNSDKFKEQYNLLTKSAVGVVMVRTREPVRAMNNLIEYAMVGAVPCKVWNFRDGWKSVKLDTGELPVAAETPQMLDPYMALKRINDVDNAGKAKWAHGIFIMHNLYTWLNEAKSCHYGIVECLVQYVRDFAESKQRLVILAPEGFILPKELMHDIVIVDFDLPSRAELAFTLGDIMETSEGCGRDFFTDAQGEMIVGSAAGLTLMEAETSFAQASIITKAVTDKAKKAHDFNQIVLKAKTEAIKQSECLELMAPVALEDIGGLDLAKAYVTARRDYFTDEARKFGVAIPKGIALVGPPRTGKSLFAKAVAAVFEQSLIRFDIGAVFGSLVGQSEERVRKALAIIKANAPCVVLLDEVDKAGMGANQGQGDSGTSSRVMGTILTFMQECEEPVYWIFTLNRVKDVRPELLGKGRLDDVFSVMNPSEQAREEILRIHLRKGKQDASKIKDLKKAVDASDGYVGAEIESAVKEAVMEAFSTKVPVSGALIEKHLRIGKPASEKFPEDYKYMVEWADQNARPSESDSAKTNTKAQLRIAQAEGQQTRRRRGMD